VTLKRKFKEEIGADIRTVDYLDVVENIFTLAGQVFHEIALVYEVEFEEESLYDQEEFDVIEDGKKTKAKWVSLEELALGETTVYPVGLLELIKKMPAPAESKP